MDPQCPLCNEAIYGGNDTVILRAKASEKKGDKKEVRHGDIVHTKCIKGNILENHLLFSCPLSASQELGKV